MVGFGLTPFSNYCDKQDFCVKTISSELFSYFEKILENTRKTFKVKNTAE
jgi:hypothetical protein